MNKCDCCGQFGELEDVTIVIKKHKACDINGALGKQATLPPMQVVPATVLPNVISSAAPYMNEELAKMIK